MDTLSSYSSRHSVECDGEILTYFSLMEDVDPPREKASFLCRERGSLFEAGEELAAHAIHRRELQGVRSVHSTDYHPNISLCWPRVSVANFRRLSAE
jgi:hypothetical protein